MRPGGTVQQARQCLAVNRWDRDALRVLAREASAEDLPFLLEAGEAGAVGLARVGTDEALEHLATMACADPAGIWADALGPVARPKDIDLLMSIREPSPATCARLFAHGNARYREDVESRFLMGDRSSEVLAGILQTDGVVQELLEPRDRTRATSAISDPLSFALDYRPWIGEAPPLLATHTDDVDAVATWLDRSARVYHPPNRILLKELLATAVGPADPGQRVLIRRLARFRATQEPLLDAAPRMEPDVRAFAEAELIKAGMTDPRLLDRARQLPDDCHAVRMLVAHGEADAWLQSVAGSREVAPMSTFSVHPFGCLSRMPDIPPPVIDALAHNIEALSKQGPNSDRGTTTLGPRLNRLVGIALSRPQLRAAARPALSTDSALNGELRTRAAHLLREDIPPDQWKQVILAASDDFLRYPSERKALFGVLSLDLTDVHERERRLIYKTLIMMFDEFNGEFSEDAKQGFGILASSSDPVARRMACSGVLQLSSRLEPMRRHFERLKADTDPGVAACADGVLERMDQSAR